MKKTKLLTSLAAFVLVLGLGACDGSDDGEVSESGDESESGSDSGTTSGAPYEDGSYFLGFNIDGVDNYITGEVNSNYSYEGLYTDDITKAVPLTLKAVEGNGYTLTFTLEEVTYYVTTVVTTNDKGTFNNLAYSTSEGLLYWNDTYSCWGDESGDYFLCCNTTYKCLYLSDVETYIETSPIAKLYEIPEDWEPYTPREDAGVSYEDVEGLSLLGYYDFSKSDYNKSDAFGSVDGETGEAKGLTQEQVVSLFSECYVAGSVETSPVTSVTSTSAYKAANGSSGGLTTSDACLKLNSSKTSDGSITLGVDVEGYTLSSVAITAAGYNNTETSLKVNGADQTLAQAANALSYIDEVDCYTYDLSDASEIAIAATSRVLIFGIAIYGEEAPAEPVTETLDIGDMDSITSGDEEVFAGATWTYLTSCNISFAANAKAKWSSNYIRAYADDEITFTPKDGHTLVGLSFTWYSGTTVKAITVVNEVASVTCDDNGAEITDIVDGSSALTIKVSGSGNDQLYIGGITISYL